jgi:hypothetical protein
MLSPHHLVAVPLARLCSSPHHTALLPMSSGLAVWSPPELFPDPMTPATKHHHSHGAARSNTTMKASLTTALSSYRLPPLARPRASRRPGAPIWPLKLQSPPPLWPLTGAHSGRLCTAVEHLLRWVFLLPATPNGVTTRPACSRHCHHPPSCQPMPPPHVMESLAPLLFEWDTSPSGWASWKWAGNWWPRWTVGILFFWFD